MQNDLMNVQSFLQNNPAGIIVVFWPTGSGKTGLSLEIATHLQACGYEPFIISADSRQIYRDMNIGTGKIMPEEMRGIPHIGLDLISPQETFSVVNYQKSIDNCPIFETWKQYPGNHVPIICGGTGLYIDALIFERDYLGSEPSQKRRQELENFRREYGNDALWQRLAALDPQYAAELHPNNSTYIIRAIEIFEETGKSKKEAESPLTLKYPALFLTPYSDSPENREHLYHRINTRIEMMFQQGLVHEVEALSAQYGAESAGLKTIGYKEVLAHLRGEISLSEAKNLVAQHNRNYAKRQISWNKKYLPFMA